VSAVLVPEGVPLKRVVDVSDASERGVEMANLYTNRLVLGFKSDWQSSIMFSKLPPHQTFEPWLPE
jgi:hypothetical protein